VPTFNGKYLFVTTGENEAGTIVGAYGGPLVVVVDTGAVVGLVLGDAFGLLELQAPKSSAVMTATDGTRARFMVSSRLGAILTDAS
jgi:hypothetical protein